MNRFLQRFSLPLTVLWALVILALSITPGKEMPEVNFWEFDKFAHIGVYSLLAFLAAGAYSAQFSPPHLRFKGGSTVLFVIILYGFGIECVQGAWIQDRYFDILDLLANIIGSITGLFAYIIIIAKRINPSL